jgi:hypothetical protein
MEESCDAVISDRLNAGALLKNIGEGAIEITYRNAGL